MRKLTESRHSHADGNPNLCSEIFKDYCKSKLLNSRLRGNGGIGYMDIRKQLPTSYFLKFSTYPTSDENQKNR